MSTQVNMMWRTSVVTVAVYTDVSYVQSVQAVRDALQAAGLAIHQ